MSVTVHHGDCLDVLRGMGEASVDSVVTDPPYHLGPQKTQEIGWPSWNGQTKEARTAAKAGFMGKTWDGGNVAFKPETWAEVLRVMKPGANIVAFSSTRTYHRMACAIEDAGFEVRDQLAWVYGTGFCKTGYIRDPKTKEIVREGWAGSLKPAWEPIVLARKPLACPTVAANVLAHGCGALNIDGCRVPADWENDPSKRGFGYGYNREGYEVERDVPVSANVRTGWQPTQGRWPPNLVHSGEPEVLEAFAAFGERRSGGKALAGTGSRPGGFGNVGAVKGSKAPCSHMPDDTGTAARFFPALGFGEDELRFHYSAKASKAERAGSKHPTVKPVTLMRWLCRLVTPPGGTVLDCFAGTGVTGEAALREGFSAVLIEREAEYHADILARLARHRDEAPLLAEVAA